MDLSFFDQIPDKIVIKGWLLVWLLKTLFEMGWDRFKKYNKMLEKNTEAIDRLTNQVNSLNDRLEQFRDAINDMPDIRNDILQIKRELNRRARH